MSHQSTRFKKKIPNNFYNSTIFLVRVPQLSYSSYCTARDKWVRSLTPPIGQKILDLGCSNGETFLSWQGTNELYGIDCSHEAVEEANKNGLNAQVGDIFNLPFEDEEFDSLCAMGVIGIFPDTQKTLSAISRPLKTGGTLYLSAATKGGIRYITRFLIKLLRVKNQMNYIPTVSRLCKDLEKAGFKIEEVAITPFFPTTNIIKKPSPLIKHIGAYSFIKATKL